MNVHPDAFGQGIAKKLLSKADELAGNLPIRLISRPEFRLLFSLSPRRFYTLCNLPRHGDFSTRARRESPRLTEGIVRDARTEDLPAILQLEADLLGISRQRDIEYF